ncbi:hypothetical protein KM043_015194 [Ampulex compressa]|nr:hypothetical protein KM043_015194 [Ampulex compressa]
MVAYICARPCVTTGEGARACEKEKEGDSKNQKWEEKGQRRGGWDKGSRAMRHDCYSPKYLSPPVKRQQRLKYRVFSTNVGMADPGGSRGSTVHQRIRAAP